MTDFYQQKQEGNMNINWKQKLSSRKLWAAVLAAVFAVISALLGDELPAEMAEILQTGIYGLIAYIFGEGAVDVARVIGGKSDSPDPENGGNES